MFWVVGLALHRLVWAKQQIFVSKLCEYTLPALLLCPRGQSYLINQLT